MAYSAVVTTGIYCRPGCSARPNAGNVVSFDVAAAAEAAGFRACLRCRPYRAAQSFSWSGPELVCRAVQLIVAGALDDATEDDLGRQLGVSARHLRRLFADHLGVTPDQLARSRRTHFARRLLDDTDLSITDIAFAAGFGSVRQFHRACRDIFRASPTELRARRRVTDRLVADGGLAMRLPFDGALDWEAMLAFLGPRAIPGVEHVDGGVYRRTVVVDGDPGVLELERGGDDHLVLRAHLPHWEGLIHVVQRARDVASLDRPYAEVDGARLPGTWDPFETGVRTILGQQISVAAATTIAGRLVERLGRPVPGLRQLGLTHVFPPPDVLAGADLAGIGLTSGRAAAVRGFAEAVATGAIHLDRSVPLPELVASVVSVRGLGPWTANYLARRMGVRDAFSEHDDGAGRVVQHPAADRTEQRRRHTANSA